MITAGDKGDESWNIISGHDEHFACTRAGGIESEMDEWADGSARLPQAKMNCGGEEHISLLGGIEVR